MDKRFLATLITISIWAFALFGIFQSALYFTAWRAWIPSEKDILHVQRKPMKQNETAKDLLVITPDGKIFIDYDSIRAIQKQNPGIGFNLFATHEKQTLSAAPQK